MTCVIAYCVCMCVYVCVCGGSVLFLCTDLFQKTDELANEMH